MDIQSYKEEFYQQGFTVIRNCIPLDLIQDSRSIIQKRLSKLLEAEFDYNEGITEAIKIYRQLDIQDLIHSCQHDHRAAANGQASSGKTCARTAW